MSDQCDTANSVAQFLTHFIEDRGRQDQGLLYPYENCEEQAGSFLLDKPYDNAPSFHMDSLLSEMRDREAASLNKNAAPTPQAYTLDSKNENVSDWATQYIESGSKFNQIEVKPFSASIWSNDFRSSTTDEFERLAKPLGKNEFDLNANWGHEFSKEPPPHFASIPDILSSIPPQPCDTPEIQLVAEQIAVSMDTPQFGNSRFLKFMNNVSEGQVHIVDNKKTCRFENEFFDWAKTPPIVGIGRNTTVVGETMTTEEAKNSFSQWGSPPLANYPDTFVETDRAHEEVGTADKEDQHSKELWSKLTERWEQMNLGGQTPWASEFNKFVASVQAYQFAEENPMADKVNALEEGKKRLESGDLPGAVLCFEAAVKQTPSSVEGWQLLGRTQAENEQDQQAIAALRKCLELDPGNLDAFKELAACYANENYQYQACDALKEWLAHHPKYKDIVEEESEETTSTTDSKASEVTSILTLKFFNEVLNMYLKAAQRADPALEADADVQNGLGVLLTLNSDYDKAIDCFDFAVQIRPDDARLWNRLGATLANGDQAERALEAYRMTLKLAPGFIRARYNLGITCIHLKMYKQAIEHLLIALNQQVSGRGINGEKSAAMSESIWTTLRLGLSLSDQRELIPMAEKKDLDALNKEFDIVLEDIEVVPKTDEERTNVI